MSVLHTPTPACKRSPSLSAALPARALLALVRGSVRESAMALLLALVRGSVRELLQVLAWASLLVLVWESGQA